MRIAACSRARTCWSVIPATIVFQLPVSATARPLLDHEHLIGRELVRDELRRARPYHDHVLDVVVVLGGLEREHHPLFQHELVAARDHRLLLVPPAADAVAGELAGVRPAVPGELLDDELIDLARGNAGPAVVDRHAVDLAGDPIVADLLRARLAEDRVARLVAGVAVDVGYVVGPDPVARPPRVVALARVGNEVSARVQDAMRPVGAAPQAATDEPAVDGALRLTGLDAGKDLEVRIVEEVGALLQQTNLAFRLHPAHLVHHRRAIDHLQLRELALDLFPVPRAHVVLLEPDALAAEPETLQHLRQPVVR